MSNTKRVDTTLFQNEHYLGKPAGEEDRIITRRIAVLEGYPEFFGDELNCIEVGCGSGATLTRLAGRFRDTLGVDIYDYSQEFERQKQQHGAVNCNFQVLDLEKELPAEKFDRLISFEVIEHLRSEDSVKNYFDLLQEGGMAAITVPNKWWIFETHGARLPLLPWNRVPFFSWLPRRLHERYAHARIYTAGRISRLLERHGFTIVDRCYITAPMDVVKEGWLKRLLTRTIFRNDSTSLPLLSTAIFLIAQKTSKHG